MVCKKMAELHRIKVSGPESLEYEVLREQTTSFTKLSKWIRKLVDNNNGNNADGNSDWTKEQCDELNKIFDFLRAQIIEFHLPIVLCHNDLSGDNILYDKALNTVNFIDWEYSGSNFQFNDFCQLFWENSGSLKKLFK